VLGLLVSQDGYPLAYLIFNGFQYEGRTMILTTPVKLTHQEKFAQLNLATYF
jgi:hypothetical protein